MRKAEENRGMVGRISFKVKLIVFLILLVVAAFAIVIAFAAGFVTGSTLTETKQKDVCTGMDASWDAQNKICLKQQAPPPAVITTSAPGKEYHCGDGTIFTLRPLSDTLAQFTRTGDGVTHSLTTASTSKSTQTYQDDTYLVLISQQDAQLTDKAVGKPVACSYAGESQD